MRRILAATLLLAAGAWAGPAVAGDTIEGTDGPDVLVGTAQRDYLQGHGGDDEVRGRAGRDLLHGNGGDDVLVGGVQSDELYGMPGTDILRGGRGDDTLVGGLGRDTAVGGPGRDYLGDFVGGDTLRGGAGHDFAVVDERYPGRTGRTDVRLGAGDDEVLIFPDGAPDLVRCGPGGGDVAWWINDVDPTDVLVGCETYEEYQGY
ncbi:MAG: calcium-binding protein [Nocardioides sp.]|jgi:Ca2+-binding RTX toxin-like protein|nr:calcium-binding protein [Nocardioides sp.]